VVLAGRSRRPSTETPGICSPGSPTGTRCWTFAVDGWSPRPAAHPQVGSGDRVVALAGTAWRHDDTDEDRLAAELIASAKDQEEHVYATQSAAGRWPATALAVGATAPEVVRLANLVHLGTWVSGQLAGDTDALTLAAALHPTAAAGTPTDLASGHRGSGSEWTGTVTPDRLADGRDRNGSGASPCAAPGRPPGTAVADAGSWPVGSETEIAKRSEVRAIRDALCD
jgi:hypothetical protein